MTPQDSGTELCTNIECEKEAVEQVQFLGVSDEPYGYCEEHYQEVRQLAE
jgi:hypothetical protein